ncbi:MAG: D-alanyl-D-alanine carboxypeptidase [Bradymonadales bacterium]
MSRGKLGFKFAILALALTTSVGEGFSQEEGPKFRELDARRQPVNVVAHVAQSDVDQILDLVERDNAPEQAKTSFIPAELGAEQLKTISQRINGILNEKALRNTNIGILIVDVETGQRVYERKSKQALKPASNMKMLTTAAALGILGSEHQFVTQVYVDGKIGKNGVLKGNLNIDIDHDFSWSTRFYNSGDLPLRELIKQIKDAGITRIDGNINLAGRVVYGGVPTATLDSNAHLQAVAKRLGVLLRAEKLSYKSILRRNSVKATGKPIATWYSPRLSEMLVPINRVSHNEYADMLLMALGAKLEKKSNFEAGARAVRAWLKDVGIDTKGLQIMDGSGLSHDNRFSAEFLTALTIHMLKSPLAAPWAASLSIAAYDGTYGGRLNSEETRGRVLVKSGTLRDVIAGSGFLVNTHDSRVYAFSLIVNGMRQKKATRAAIDRIVRSFSGDNLQSPPPQTVRMQSLLAASNNSVVAKWEQSKGATGYRIWQSDDGQNAWRVIAETNETRHTLPLGDKPLFIRVSAYNDKGIESLASKVFAYHKGAQMLTIVEAAACAWDEHTRPETRIFSPHLALGAALPENIGVQTVSPTSLPAQNDVILWHGGVCAQKCDLQTKALKDLWKSKTPLILDYFDAHLLAEAQERCEPENGAIGACFKTPVISMDRRINECGPNNRLRKATGSGSTRPSAIADWGDAKRCLSMQNTTIANCSKSQKRAIIGFDMAAFDTLQSQRAAWEQIFYGIGIEFNKQ